MTSEVIELEALAQDLFGRAGNNVEVYPSIAKALKKSLKFSTISSEVLSEVLKVLKVSRKSRRFYSLGFSTLLSELEMTSVGAIEQGHFWALHAQLALNLNVAGLAYSASLQAVEHLKAEPSLELVRSYSLMATASRNLGRFPEAIKFYGIARALAEEQGWVEMGVWQLFKLGKMYVNYLEQPSRGLKYLMEAASEFQKRATISAKRGSAACLDEVGDIYRQTTVNLDRAEQLYLQAMDINSEISYSAGIARNKAHLGLCAAERNDLPAARSLLEESVAMTRQASGQERGVGLRLGQLAKVFIEIGDLDCAAECLREAVEISRQFRDFRAEAKHEVVQGILCRKLRDFVQAREHFEQAVGIASAHKFFDVELTACDQLAALFLEDLEDYGRAKEFVLRSSGVRQKSWQFIAESTPSLEEVENKVEIANMYQSLFAKLLRDYREDLDGTISVAYEIALSESRSRYQSLFQLVRFGAFMAGARHETLNLLNEVYSRLSTVAREASRLTRGGIEALDSARELLLGGAELLRSSLPQSLLQSPDRRPVEAVSAQIVLPPIYEWLRQEVVRKAGQIEFLGQIPNLQVAMEPVLLRVILVNLLQNSCEAFDAGEKICIRLLTRPDRGEYLLIEFSDFGSGIETTEIGKIFEVGYSTKKGHSGLGLPTINFLLESFGGRVEIDSSAGQGTTVHVFVPVL